jgi:hypothetical protein
MNVQEKIIREFIRESLLSNEIIVESSFTSGVKSAVSDLGKVVAGSAATILASVKQLTGLTYQAIKEVGSLGIFKADYDKVKSQYHQNLAEIQKEYGAEIDAAEKTFSKALFPLTSAAKIGLGATATAFFFANPLAFIALEGTATGTSKKIKGEVVPKIKDLKSQAQKAIDKWSGYEEQSETKNKGNDLLRQDWVREGQQKFKQSTELYFKQINDKIKKISSAADVKSLGIPDKIVQQLSKDSKNQAEILKACKALALNEILNTVKVDKEKQIADAKKANVPESAITGSKSFIKLYDKIIVTINEKISSLK